MRKGLLLSAAGLLLAGSWTAYGACTPVLKCASLGYKYSSSECSEGGLACPFDTSKYFCAEPCTYTVTKATCDSQCKNVGDKACTKNGTAYYDACGSSKCSSGQTCNNGTCVSPAPTSGWCCAVYTNYCGYSGGASNSYDSDCHSYWGMRCYNKCKTDGYPDCNDMHANCRASGGTPVFQDCAYTDSFGDYYRGGFAYFACQ